MILLNQTVEIFGLVSRCDLNGKIGRGFQYDATKSRYLVVTNGERISVREENLRPKDLCRNRRCNVAGLVLDKKSMRSNKAHVGSNRTLFVCSGCGDATYCSRTCQKEDWCLHKKVCSVAKDVLKIKKLFSKNRSLNWILQSEEMALKKEYDLDGQVLVSFQFSDREDLKRSLNKNLWRDPRHISSCLKICAPDRIRELLPQIPARDDPTGFWNIALEQTDNYNKNTHMSVLVLVCDSGMESNSFAENMVIPRLGFTKMNYPSQAEKDFSRM